MIGLEASSIIFEFCRRVTREMVIATMLVISEAMMPKSWIISEGFNELKNVFIEDLLKNI
jgi:hypothetical protein